MWLLHVIRRECRFRQPLVRFSLSRAPRSGGGFEVECLRIAAFKKATTPDALVQRYQEVW